MMDIETKAHQMCLEGGRIDAGEVFSSKARALDWCGKAGNSVMHVHRHLQVRTELAWTTWEL
jgi:hypothetical protein